MLGYGLHIADTKKNKKFNGYILARAILVPFKYLKWPISDILPDRKVCFLVYNLGGDGMGGERIEFQGLALFFSSTIAFTQGKEANLLIISTVGVLCSK